MYDLLIKFIADWLMFPMIAVALYALLFKVAGARRYDRYTRVFMAGITSYILAKFIGSAWRPEQLRPFEKLGVDPGAAYLDNPGFPSDHALLAFFLLFAVWYCTRNRLFTVVVGVMVLLVCVGRVLALVHTPLDIAGSLIITLVSTVWYKDYVKTKLYKFVGKKAKT